MKWLQDNPLGMALAGMSAFMVLLAAALAIVWALPVSVEITELVIEDNASADTALAAHQAGPLSEFLVINERPVFNESRQPVITELDEEGGAEDLAIEVKDAPDVKLTGVIITPSMKIASLTLASGDENSVMAHEGESLTGEFVGWQISSISPRSVMLESRNGQTLELELQIHDVPIEEPPKPAPTAKTVAGHDGESGDEPGQPLSRAEQIRQRIAERREELRREQEDQQSQGEPDRNRNNPDRPPANTASSASEPQDYESAIRALMNNTSKEKPSNDNNDG